MTEPSTTVHVNRWLDELPRTWVWRVARGRPAFRSCGVAACYLASIATVGAGLRAGLPLATSALLIAIGVVSFFVLALVRRALTGREDLVLLEHVWLVLIATAGAMWCLGEPVFAALDVACIGLCGFLAVARLGCLMVGCCHGVPASLGITYGAECARDGFAVHLVDVRLAPVPAVEAVAWLAFGVIGVVALPSAVPGLVTVWVLAAYAILRFGLESIRGDDRPMLLGRSQAQWMATLQGAGAILLAEQVAGRAPFAMRPVAAAAGLVTLVAIVSVVIHAVSPRRRLLGRAHVAEVRALVGELVRHPPEAPRVGHTSRGVTIGVSGGSAWIGSASTQDRSNIHRRSRCGRPPRRRPHHRASENRQSASVASPGNKLSTATPGTGRVAIGSDSTCQPRAITASMRRRIPAASLAWSAGVTTARSPMCCRDS